MYKSEENKASGVAQVAEHLPSKCEALNSGPSTTKKKRGGAGENRIMNT
jgi:hypothetical protein